MKAYGLLIWSFLLTSLAPTAQAQVCTREYAPLCGQVANEPVAQIFSNRCLLKAAHAAELPQEQCAFEKSLWVGTDTDTHGCKPSAGYLWDEELAGCVRPWMSSAVTIEVAAKRRACTGLIEMQCLMVRELRAAGDTNSVQVKPKWKPLFGEIIGFKKDPGKRYTLRVRKDRLESPPADTSGTTYTLLRVLK